LKIRTPMRHSASLIARHLAGNAHDILWMIRNNSPSVAVGLISELLRARIAMASTRHLYRELSARDLEARKRSERVFIFGSGYSINDISESEWAFMSRYDTIGFSGSIYLRNVPITYLLLRAWTETPAGSLSWRKDAEEVTGAIAANPALAETCFILQHGLTAIFGNRLIGHRLWNTAWPVYFYLSDKVSKMPHRRLADGIVNSKSTLCSAVSLASALKYKEIVLVGVDLYDNRYFWLPPDKTMGWSDTEQKLVPADETVRGLAVTSTHNTVSNGIIQTMREWAEYLRKRYGVEMSVYNPKSLLARELPVFSWINDRSSVK
jgi:hypothetical protein